MSDFIEENSVRKSQFCELSDNVSRRTCSHCNEKITGEVNALIFGTLSFHPNHFKCCICEIELNGKSFKEKNTQLYCIDCYEKKFSMVCTFCRESVEKVKRTDVNI